MNFLYLVVRDINATISQLDSVSIKVYIQCNYTGFPKGYCHYYQPRFNVNEGIA